MPKNGSAGMRRLSNLDASFLFIESRVSPMHGGPIFVLNGELSFDRLFRHMEERLHIAPRFRQRLVFAPFNLAHPAFADDPDFKLENHVPAQGAPQGNQRGGRAEGNRALPFRPRDGSLPPAMGPDSF